MTSRDHRRCCEAVRSAILATAWLLVLIVEVYVLYLEINDRFNKARDDNLAWDSFRGREANGVFGWA